MIVGSPTILNLVPGGVMKCVHVNQVNKNIEIQFKIMNGAAPYNLPEGVTCTIRGTKGDAFGYAAEAAVTAGSNVITVTLTEQLTAVAGAKNIFELVFVGAADDMKVSTENFILAVERQAMGEDTVISDSDLSYAEQVLDQLQSVGAVNAQVQQNKTNLAAEISRAQAAEAAEAAARQAADNTLQSNINAEASTRATQDASLQSQINQLVAPSGSAPSAAEITNARVGADGTVYPTLGDAIRTQNIQLKSAINRLYNPIKWETGKCILNGRILTSETYNISEYYLVSPGITFHCVTALNTATLNLALFDKDKKIIKTYTQADGTQLKGYLYTFDITVPYDLSSDPVYFAFTCKLTHIGYATFEYTRIVPDLCAKIFDIETAIGNIFDPETIRASEAETGKAILYASGKRANSEGYLATDYISFYFARGATVSINGCFYGTIGCAFFDESKEYISGIGGNNISDYGGTSIRAMQTINVLPPESARYIRITGYGDITANDLWVRGVTIAGITMDIMSLETDVKSLKAITPTTFAQSKVLVLGDSISADAYGSYKKWVTDLIEEGFFTAENVNNISQHATGYVARYNSGDNRFIDRLSAVADKDTYDLVVIYGGTNDYIQNIPMGAVGGDADTDFIPAVKYLFEYAIQNFTQARICIISPTRTYATWKNQQNQYETDYFSKIREIAKDYCYPVLNLTEESGFCPYIQTFRNLWTLQPQGYESHDGVHPNEEYEKKYIAPMIKQFLKGLM